jgi:hypothetical protein
MRRDSRTPEQFGDTLWMLGTHVWQAVYGLKTIAWGPVSAMSDVLATKLCWELIQGIFVSALCFSSAIYLPSLLPPSLLWFSDVLLVMY